MLLVALIARASYVSPLPSLAAKRPASPRTGTILLEALPPPPPSLYEEYLQTRDSAKSYTAPAPAPEPTATATQWQEWEENGTLPPGYDGPPPTYVPTSQAAPPGAETNWRAVAYPPNAAPTPGIDWSPGWSRPGGGIRHPLARPGPYPYP